MFAIAPVRVLQSLSLVRVFANVVAIPPITVEPLPLDLAIAPHFRLRFCWTRVFAVAPSPSIALARALAFALGYVDRGITKRTTTYIAINRQATLD